MDGVAGGTTKSAAWRPFAWIVLASAAAHLWCLGSQFYLDDPSQIRDSEVVRSGAFWKASLSAWTYLWYIIQSRLFGYSPIAYHAVNWLLHTAVACVLFGFSRDFLRGKSSAGVPLFAALLFAVHPLGSEIPNYARTQDMAWVTLFSLSAGWLLMNFLRQGGAWRIAACAACGLGATFSKGPGILHAAMVCAVVGMVALSPGQRGLLRRNIWWIALVTVALGALLWFVMADRLAGTTARWAEPRFIGHAYTLARVFWEFAWRAVVPVALSSDHLVTETLMPPGATFWTVPDKIAQLAMAGMLAAAALGIWLMAREKSRALGVCLVLFVMTILFRVLYPVPEFMPEYRIYPGMPWFCLGAAIVLAAGWKWLFETVPAKVPAVILLATFAALSARRSFVWHDSETLAADVLDRYPARIRVLWELSDRDIERQNWQAIIDRQRDLWPQVESRFIRENQRLAPVREIPSGDFVLAMVAVHGRYALALAHTSSPAAGLGVMARLEAQMAAMKMTPLNKPREWGYFYHDKALILEMAGDIAGAAELLRQDCVPPFWPDDLKRVEAKLAEFQPGS